jgi:hypothetical protein
MRPVVLALTLLLASLPLSANLVQPLGSSTQIVIPAAGSTAGANGTFFRTEVTILNYRDSNQAIQVLWMPQGGTAVVSPEMTINARSGVASQDFVGQVLGQTGLGSIVISAVLPGTNTLDTAARLYVTARIWTPQPGTTGTTSQTFSTIPLASLNSTRQAMVGIRRDTQYRLNIGLVNLDNTRSQTFLVTLGGALGQTETVTVSVNPLSMQQVAMPGGNLANPQILVENVTPVATRSTRWTSYASSIDNVTGDSWSVVGFDRPDAP